MKFDFLYKSDFAKGILRFIGGNILSVALQAAQFVLLARMFGASQFGQIAVANAIAAIALPLAGMGYGNVMLMEVSRERENRAVWVGNAIVSTVVSGGFLILICLLLYKIFLGVDLSVILLSSILVVELLLLRFNTLAAQLSMALEQFKQAARFNVLASLSKFIATCGMFLFEEKTLHLWGGLLISTAILSSMISFSWMRQSVARFRFDFLNFKRSFSPGIAFAFGISAKSIYTDGDKVVLGRVSTSEVVGAYASAYRLAVIAFMPIRALLDASAARFFRSGRGGLRDSFEYGRKLLLFSAPYALCASLCLYLFSFAVPLILGPSFADSVLILKALAPLPLIQCVHYIFSDVLTTSGRQWLRSILQFLTVMIYLALAFFLIPEMGWKGAAITCVVSETILAALVLFASIHYVRKETDK